MSARADRPLVRLNGVTVCALLLGAALATWIVTVERMRGMDAGPGTDLGGLGWFVGVWVTMMAAMMFPSSVPMVLLFSRVTRERARKGQAAPVSTATFLAGYLAAWTLYGLGAYGLYRGVVGLDLGFLAWDRHGPYVAGAAVALAGVYELTPLKSVCLRHCRSPLHFLLHGWREGRLGALRMGFEHGAYCVGCCWSLMLVLFALGVMSVAWMAIVAALIFAQKVLPGGRRWAYAFAVLFVGLGVWVAAAPGGVPGLTQPDSDKAEQARMRMMPMAPASEMNPGNDQMPMNQEMQP